MKMKQNKQCWYRNSILLLLLSAASAHAQLYKSVGPDGKITYSDMPPQTAPGVKVERKSFNSAGGDDANLPFEVADARKNNPVVLYTTPNCAPCDQGRNLLKTRGIPYQEKTVVTNDDQAKLREAGGDGQLPLLLVGKSRQVGFETGTWNLSLTAAGYPESSVLPKTYQNPPAEAAAPTTPIPKPEADPANANLEQNGEPRRKPSKRVDQEPKPTPGFRF